jgi:ribosomal protein S18 acetylase RimI-like enzyme
VTLRAATVHDADALVALEASAFGADGWTRGAVLHELTSAWRYVVVAEHSGASVGWGVLLESDVCDVLRVAVAKPVQRQGIGRALLDALLNRAGSRAVLLEVAADNTAAHALYAGAGFVEIDRRPAYYGPGRDALVLSRAPDDPVYGVPRA